MKIKKILLIWPYVERKKVKDERVSYNLAEPRFPLGIGYISAYLEQFGYEVEILDLWAEQPEPVDLGKITRYGLTDEEIVQRIKDSEAQIVGISQMFSYQDPICRKIFTMVKKYDSGIITVWGGTHPTCMTNECMQFTDVDYIILGEGEKPFKDLLDRLNAGENVAGLKSLAYRDENGQPVINNDRSWIEDLNEHVLPERSKVDMNKYKQSVTNGMTTFNMITSRGCPYKCTFCTAPMFYQQRYKGRTPEKVVDEMELLMNEYGAKLITVDDENLTSDMKRIEEIMDVMIARKLKVRWYAQVGVTIARLNWTIIEKMKKTGFTELRLALESGDAQMLRTMKKPLVLRQARDVMKWVRQADIRVVSFLLMGMPGETLEQMQNTVNFANELGFDWNIISMVLPLPGTQIYADLMEEDFSVDYVDLERYTLPVPGVSNIPSEDLIAFREHANNLLNFEDNYHLVKGDTAVAIHDFETLIKSYPTLEKVWYYLAMGYYKAGNIEKAKVALEKLQQIDPNYKNGRQWLEYLRDDRVLQVDADFRKQSETSLGYKYGHDLKEGQAPRKQWGLKEESIKYKEQSLSRQ